MKVVHLSDLRIGTGTVMGSNPVEHLRSVLTHVFRPLPLHLERNRAWCTAGGPSFHSRSPVALSGRAKEARFATGPLERNYNVCFIETDTTIIHTVDYEKYGCIRLL